MSSCLSGGGRAYGFEIEIIKSPSTSTITSQTSSPSSTLSESSNSPLVISTRKPRTPRKRPNQTYNEAAALLSTACPNIFPPKHLSKPLKKIIKPHHHESNFLLNDSCPSAVDLLLPFRVFDNTGFLLNQPVPEKPNSRMELLSRIGSFRENSSCQSPEKSDFRKNSSELCNLEDFDAESILDEEIEEGIDSIMGGNNDYSLSESDFGSFRGEMSSSSSSSSCYGTFPMGLGLGLGFGGEFGFFSRALRHVDEGEWWRFPIVDVVNISPKLNNHHKSHTEKKKKNKVEKAGDEVKYRLETSPKQVKENPIPKQQKENEKEKEKEQEKENSIPKSNPGLLLKLNLDEVANAWSDRDWPFSDEISGQESDLHARLAQIDLFSENGGVREASVLRYKEKRRTRLFSKKIRYQVRKVNADRRPRMKGRFVRRPDSP